jgi:3-isopropylmalate/(R)-2-methylmalate dehydratase small subunit
MKTLGGPLLFLDRDDINTDEIIPARYLNEDSREALGPYCFEDLSLRGFDRAQGLPGKGAVISRANFGCGSSREHAPWALEANGINIVVAESFARIFRQNMFNCGMVAVELPKATIAEVFERFSGAPTDLAFDAEHRTLRFSSRDGGNQLTVPFVLGDFEMAMVRAGGWVTFAADRY